MQFGLLGPLLVTDGDRELAVGGPKQRSVLALLLLEANRPVSTADLIDGVWGDSPPDRATATIQVYISNLRKVLQPNPGDVVLIERASGGYRVHVAAEDLDIHRFEHLAGVGRAALVRNDPASAEQLLRTALDLVRGRPGADLHGDRVRHAATRIEEMCLSAEEAYHEARIRRGRHSEVVGDLSTAIPQHPFRERLRVLQMIALYQSGRQAEALAAGREARELLLDELGIDPGPELQATELTILNQEPVVWSGADPADPERDTPRSAATADADTERQHGVADSSAELVLPDGSKVVLGGQPVTIGRGTSCTISIRDGNVSRRHAVIRHIGTDYVLSDLGSTNGTTVNGESVADHRLRDGDCIELAGRGLRFLRASG